MKESVLQTRVAKHFRENSYIAVREVPVLEYRIDVAALNPDTHEIYAIETKLANWRKALQQALVYRLVADRAYIAIWRDGLVKVDFDLVRKFGIGLLEVDGKVKTILEAEESNVVHESIRSRVLKILQREAYRYGR